MSEPFCNDGCTMSPQEALAAMRIAHEDEPGATAEEFTAELETLGETEAETESVKSKGQNHMTRHFVTFYSPGTFVCESTERPIDSWDASKATEMAREIKERHAATPFGFKFSTRERGTQDLDSRVSKTSGMFFLGGTLLTLEDVERTMPEERILISNMRGNKIERVCVNNNSWRSIHPFENGDTLLDFKTES